MADRPKLYLNRCIQQDLDGQPLWWRPNRLGYTTDIHRAGLYPRNAAMPLGDAATPWHVLSRQHETHSVQVEAEHVVGGALMGASEVARQLELMLGRVMGSERCEQCGACSAKEAGTMCRPQEDESGERWCEAECLQLWRDEVPRG